MIEHLLFNCQS